MSYIGYMYNKLFTKILDSSVWLEDNATRIVWLTLLAAMDEEGMCQFASVRNLAYRARVTDDEATNAVDRLEGPDGDSSDPDNEGRRIERVPGGWIVLNAPKYRDLVTREVIKEKTRLRVAEHRKKKRGELGCNAGVTAPKRLVTPSDTATRALAVASTDSKDTFPTSEHAKRIATLFSRRLTTAWGEKEIKAFKALAKRKVLTNEALTLLEAYYKKERANGEMGHHRRDLSTFLNNFDGELDRASQGQQPLKLGDQAPEGWDTFTRTSPQYCEWVGEYQHAPAFMRSDFEKWKAKL